MPAVVCLFLIGVDTSSINFECVGILAFTYGTFSTVSLLDSCSVKLVVVLLIGLFMLSAYGDFFDVISGMSAV